PSGHKRGGDLVHEAGSGARTVPPPAVRTGSDHVRGVDDEVHAGHLRARRLPWTAVSVESVFPALELLLPRVSKPVQYIGGELNSTVKDWDGAAVHWALMYPDAYEVGLPNQGVMILYELLNEQPDVLAERAYAVWPDL